MSFNFAGTGTSTRKNAGRKGTHRKSASGYRAKKPAAEKTFEKKVTKIVTKVNKKDEEIKRTVVWSSVAFCSYTPVLGLVTMPSQGDTASTRDGDKIKLRHLQIRAGTDEVDDLYDTMYRLVIFHWLDDNEVSTPDLAEIFDTSGGGWSGSYLAPFLPINVSKTKPLFSVIHDQTYNVNHDTNRFALDIDVNIKMNKTIYFNQGLNTGKGMLYYYWISNRSNAQTRASYLYTKLEYVE